MIYIYTKLKTVNEPFLRQHILPCLYDSKSSNLEIMKIVSDILIMKFIQRNGSL